LPYPKDAFINSYALAINVYQEAHIVGWLIMLALVSQKLFKTLNPNGWKTLICHFVLEVATMFAKIFAHFDNLLVGPSVPKCIPKFIPNISLIPKQHWYIPYPYLPIPSFKKWKLMLDNLIDLDGYQGGS
jgi:hypothetical protein